MIKKDHILKFDKGDENNHSKVVAFYVVSSIESSDQLLKKHGITKMDLYLQMSNYRLFDDYDDINMKA